MGRFLAFLALVALAAAIAVASIGFAANGVENSVKSLTLSEGDRVVVNGTGCKVTNYGTNNPDNIVWQKCSKVIDVPGTIVANEFGHYINGRYRVQLINDEVWWFDPTSIAQ